MAKQSTPKPKIRANHKGEQAPAQKRQGAGGRPPKWRDEFAEQAEKLAALGLTDEEIAGFIGVTVRTLYRWKGKYPEICHALKVGKVPADDRVERSLYQMAVGYEQEAVKIFMPAGAKKPVHAPYMERVAPSPAAAIFWLKNRRGDKWRDKPEEPGDEDAPPSSVTVTVVSGRKDGGGRADA